MLTAAWEPKLIDCGLSKLLDPDALAATKGTTGVAFGTPGYMCPLYLSGRGYDATSEVFSFGVVLLELLTGRLATARGCGLLAQHFLEAEDPEDEVLSWPLATCLDGAWAECPRAVRDDLCALALACVKGTAVKVVAKRPSMAAAMQQLLRLERGCRVAAADSDLARLAAENASLVAAMADLAAERERGIRMYECAACGESLPLRAGLLCAGRGPGGDRHFLCGPLGNGCADGHVVARCGGADRGAPELVHVTAAGRVLGLACAIGGAGCGLFAEAALPVALLPATYDRYRAALVELERHAAATAAERAAKTAADLTRDERLRQQAVRLRARHAAAPNSVRRSPRPRVLTAPLAAGVVRSAAGCAAGGDCGAGRSGAGRGGAARGCSGGGAARAGGGQGCGGGGERSLAAGQHAALSQSRMPPTR